MYFINFHFPFPIFQLDVRHFSELEFTQRLTAEEWKRVLLNKQDQVFFNDSTYQLEIKRDLGFGVYEIGKRILS